MTASCCVGALDLDRLTSFDGGSRRRRHVDRCPRCRALLAQFRAFLDPPPLAGAEEIADALERLAHALEREMESVRRA